MWLKRTHTSLLCLARWVRGMPDGILQPLSRAWRGMRKENLGWSSGEVLGAYRYLRSNITASHKLTRLDSMFTALREIIQA